MAMTINLALPHEVAESITRDGLAVWPLETRADPTTVAIAVSLLGVAANLATVVASADALQEIAQRLARWALRHPLEAGHDAPISLEISVQGEPRVSVALSDGEAVAVTVLRDELTRIVVAIAQQKSPHGE
jgi:hypothetical protein